MDIEQMFRSALDVLDEAVCLCEQTGQVIYANPAAERLTGCSGGEARGKSCRKVLGSLATTILESIRGEESKTYQENVALAGNNLEYSICRIMVRLAIF